MEQEEAHPLLAEQAVPVTIAQSQIRLVNEAWCGSNPGVDNDQLGSTLDELISRHPEECYVVRARGQSMVRARILDGDLVVVRAGQRGRGGFPVLAVVDNELVIRMYRIDDFGRGVLWSCPASGHDQCVSSRSVEILGTVESVIIPWTGLSEKLWGE